MRGLAWLACAVSLLVLGGPAVPVPPDDPPPKGRAGVAGFPDLVAALKATPGCLGVETAQTGSGKSVIFAWFEDKAAALRWYNSDTHREVMRQFLPDFKSGRKPLADVPDDGGPVLAIASVTPNAKPTKDDPSPFKQIAIELYRPLGGGLSIGGRFAPEKMKVPPRKDEPKK
jgi:hypothetical protein